MQQTSALVLIIGNMFLWGTHAGSVLHTLPISLEQDRLTINATLKNRPLNIKTIITVRYFRCLGFGMGTS